MEDVMSEVTRKLLLDMYGGKGSWCDSYGKPLFPSEQSARAYIAGDHKLELMRLGLLFIVGKSIKTDEPEALFNAIVAMKKDDSRALAETAASVPVGLIEPVKPRHVRIASPSCHQGDQFKPEPA
ncbi:hypothetical protein [Paraburkholderia youngii]|uniref:hypothetical protein n=1 Tax=Paraburkholderia youngii TaxID=2782701 RepID=UPI003D1F1225